MKLLLLIQAFATLVMLPFVSSLRQLSEDLTSIHFIGDLHADVGCAKKWVQKTQLVDITTTPFQWLGDPEKDAIVFLGDYVDKGSTSADVLKFVKELQETFPNNIVTMLGNHDVFLILDTALSFYPENPHPLGFPFYDYAYSFMHPEEYLESDWVENRDDDEEVYEALVSALQVVYDKRLEGSVHLCAPNCTTDQQIDMFQNILPFKTDEALREKSQNRLATWRAEYAQGLFDSGILSWMTKQPIVAVVADALLVHGGVSELLVNYMGRVVNNSPPGVTIADAMQQLVNEPFQKFFATELAKVDSANAIEERMKGGHVIELIMDMIQHRGYFDRQKGCNEVNHVIQSVGNEKSVVNRIVVGHTPHDYAFEACNGKLLASDSSLSRSFRAHGNLYCPLSKDRSGYKHGRSCGKKQNEQCEGSISKMTRASKDDPWPSSVTIMRFDEVGLDSGAKEDTDSSTTKSEL